MPTYAEQIEAKMRAEGGAHTPARAALYAAVDALAAAVAAEDECEDDDAVDALIAARDTAEAAVVAARDALRDSDEACAYVATEEGVDHVFVADDDDEAVRLAGKWVAEGDYEFEPGDGSIWVGCHLYAEWQGGDDRIASPRVQIDPPEPDCDSGEDHDWQSPHEIVGGIKDNPGVWGNGGGIVSTEVCMLCGCGRTTDTWAQDPGTGSQGLTSVSYEAGKYADEIAERRLAEDCAAVEAAIDAVVSYESSMYEGGVYRLALDDAGDDDPAAEAALAEIRRGLPAGWCADWTGDGNTDKGGDSTSDVLISRD